LAVAERSDLARQTLGPGGLCPWRFESSHPDSLASLDLRRELEDRGLPKYLSAQLGEIDITFHDASASLGHDIEIHVDSKGLRDSFQMVREGAEAWDGSEPLRPAAT
jgi:hypothetical protein